MRRTSIKIFTLGCLLAGNFAVAQGLSDPTRPPPGWLPGETKTSVKTEPRDNEAAVQLVLSGKTRRFAIVRGDLLSDTGKGPRVVEIRRNDLVVQSERGRETLSLFPDVQKTPPKKRDGMGHKDQK